MFCKSICSEGMAEEYSGIGNPACIGVLQMVIAGKESKESLSEVVRMLRSTSNPQVEYIVRTISKWAADHGVQINAV